LCVLCVVSKGKKAKCRRMKTKTQLRMKYKRSKREEKNPDGGEIFRTRPDGACGQPGLLCSGYRVSFSGVKWPGCGPNHRPPFSAEVKERVEPYLHFLSGPSWPLPRRTLLFVIIIIISAALGWSWLPQANVASDCYPWQASANSHSPASLRLPSPRQSILILIGHVLVDLHALELY
jgi:hypothetical protein